MAEGKTVAVLGSGVVGEVLADGFLKKYNTCTVIRGSRDVSKMRSWLDTKLTDENIKDRAKIGTYSEAAGAGDILVLAVAGGGAVSALELCGEDNLIGKIIIDATNPISGPPEDGLLPFFAGTKDSLMEMLQEKFGSARFVKAFSCTGNELMIDPDFGDSGPPTMFICGDDSDAKATVTSILDTFGWETWDMGSAKSARAIEPLCQLWCIPAIRGTQRYFAFKMLTK